jgi:hypothetical protein
MATSTKQKAQRQCYSQREGQSGQKIEYSVDCLVGHSCMLYLITDFFGKVIFFGQSNCFREHSNAQLGGSDAYNDMVAQKFRVAQSAEL